MIPKSIIIDTDIFIDLLRGYDKALIFFNSIRERKYDANVSVITVMELMSGKSTVSKEEQEKIRRLVDLFKIVNVNFEIARNAGFIKRDYDLEFGEAIIASSAKSLPNCSVVTRNIKHYQKIKDFKIIEPYNTK